MQEKEWTKPKRFSLASVFRADLLTFPEVSSSEDTREVSAAAETREHVPEAHFLRFLIFARKLTFRQRFCAFQNAAADFPPAVSAGVETKERIPEFLSACLLKRAECGRWDLNPRRH
jgi:hypothetical protein